MTVHNIKNLDFTDGRIICNDLRLGIRQQPKPSKTQGKAILIDERESKATNTKTSTIAVKDAGIGRMKYLAIIHGIDENIENVFLRNSRDFYWGFMATILKLAPMFTYIIILYGWMLVYEQMIKKRFAYFTTTTTIILGLLLLLTVAATVIIVQYLSKEVIFEGNFTKIAEHDRAIDFYFDGELIHQEATVYVGFIWHYFTSDSKLFNVSTLGTFLAEPLAKRRKIIIDVEQKTRLLLKLYKTKKEQEEKVKILEIQKIAYERRGTKIPEQFTNKLNDEIKKLEKLINDFNMRYVTLQKEAEIANNKIQALIDGAAEEFKKNIQSMLDDRTTTFDLNEFIRLAEYATELQHENQTMKIRQMNLREQISVMRKQATDSNRAAVDVTLSGSPEAQKLATLEAQYRLETQLKKKPIDWNNILRPAIPIILCIIMLGIMILFVNSIKDISKTEALIWVVGSLLGMAMIGSVLVMIFQTFRPRQPAFRVEGVQQK